VEHRSAFPCNVIFVRLALKSCVGICFAGSTLSLIFPNIEMRLALGTVRGRWVNVHFSRSRRIRHLIFL
jgi:hypothetical protein